MLLPEWTRTFIYNVRRVKVPSITICNDMKMRNFERYCWNRPDGAYEREEAVFAKLTPKEKTLMRMHLSEVIDVIYEKFPELLTRKEANNLLPKSTVNPQVLKKYKVGLMAYIKKSAISGKVEISHSCGADNYLDVVVAWLRGLGYKVTINTDETELTINWE